MAGFDGKEKDFTFHQNAGQTSEMCLTNMSMSQRFWLGTIQSDKKYYALLILLSATVYLLSGHSLFSATALAVVFFVLIIGRRISKAMVEIDMLYQHLDRMSEEKAQRNHSTTEAE